MNFDLEERKRKLLFVRRLGIAHLILRLKFLLGIFLLVWFIGPILFVDISFKDLKQDLGSWLGVFVTMLIIWILLTIADRIVLVIFAFKLNSLADDLEIRNNQLLLSKLSTIKTIAIVGIFIAWLDIIATFMFLSLYSRHRNDMINPDQQIVYY
ncbi:hypothetical protein [Mesomycoplasma hyopneumoniae]|uniref:hypothetical protein n=1 Tax=Mesomycoplasma hyopneumoniae TaxID=2099 RepID=UPI001F385D83|nr:hypothetical protein [Mesomycoplasma hyopneumoniae]UIF66915.1 hypothetical protein KUD10_02895 [Mesomycoplasma hyopneumoniae]